MSGQVLSSRAIKGEFVRLLEQDTGANWVEPLSMLFTSNQAGEEYKWIGQSPTMREWVGGRQAKGFIDNGIEIKNLHYEATIQVLVRDMRRDKTGQLELRLRELAERTNGHWARILSDLILNAPAQTCYDGQFFFDTDHSEGESGVQSNDISVDISGLPVQVEGVPTQPSPEQMQQAILKGISQMHSFVDDRGEPINETAQRFLVMAPTSLSFVAMNALTMPRATGVTEQKPINFMVDLTQNPRLNSWTDKFAVFRTDGSVKPFIRQQETFPDIKRKGEGSDFEFDEDAHEIGVDTWRNVGYGYWQHACLVTMI